MIRVAKYNNICPTVLKCSRIMPVKAKEVLGLSQWASCISYLDLLQLGWELTHLKMNYEIIHTCQSNIMRKKYWLYFGCHHNVVIWLYFGLK